MVIAGQGDARQQIAGDRPLPNFLREGAIAERSAASRDIGQVYFWSGWTAPGISDRHFATKDISFITKE